MCGYIIMNNKLPAVDLKALLQLQRHRGTDGFGALHLPTGKTCRASSAGQFLSTYKACMPRAGSIIVHHRKASMGGVRLDLVHPLRQKETGLCILQNGTKHSLAECLDVDSDTQAMLSMWPLLKDTPQCAAFLRGAGLVFVWDKGKLFGSHDGKRTLWHCAEGKYAGIFCSEPLTRGMWKQCPPIVGIPAYPLKVADWPAFLPLKEAVEFAENKAYIPVDNVVQTKAERREAASKALNARRTSSMMLSPHSDYPVYSGYERWPQEPRKAPRPVLECVTVPAPNKKTVPAPNKKTSPAPNKKTSPAPNKKTSPAPNKKTSPARRDKTGLVATLSAPTHKWLHRKDGTAIHLVEADRTRAADAVLKELLDETPGHSELDMWFNAYDRLTEGREKLLYTKGKVAEDVAEAVVEEVKRLKATQKGRHKTSANSPKETQTNTKSARTVHGKLMEHMPTFWSLVKLAANSFSQGKTLGVVRSSVAERVYRNAVVSHRVLSVSQQTTAIIQEVRYN